jgi:hypothetical protein
MINKILELNGKLREFLSMSFGVCVWFGPTILSLVIYFSDPNVPTPIYFLLGLMQIVFISAILKFYKDFLDGK